MISFANDQHNKNYKKVVIKYFRFFKFSTQKLFHSFFISIKWESSSFGIIKGKQSGKYCGCMWK